MRDIMPRMPQGVRYVFEKTVGWEARTGTFAYPTQNSQLESALQTMLTHFDSWPVNSPPSTPSRERVEELLLGPSEPPGDGSTADLMTSYMIDSPKDFTAQNVERGSSAGKRRREPVQAELD